MAKPTEWQAQTRNRGLRRIMKACKVLTSTERKLRATTDPALVASLLNAAQEEASNTAREIQACLEDLGYQPKEGNTDE